MKAIKHSKQRDSIKTCLMGRRDHPTADAVYMSIREEFPNISLGTVYRNLNLLVDLGEIQIPAHTTILYADIAAPCLIWRWIPSPDSMNPPRNTATAGSIPTPLISTVYARSA